MLEFVVRTSWNVVWQYSLA